MAALNDLLRELDALPPGLLDCPAEGLLERLGGPTLISLAGREREPVFLSVLLHGNETSGWNGLRRWLARQDVLPRSIVLFIGNVRAAAADVRTLPDQRDHNRIWPTLDEPEATLSRAVRSVIDGRRWFVAVDLHNNTGHNPAYAILTDVTPGNLGLARLLSDTAVLVSEPKTVLTRLFDGLCPAVTLELGAVGDERSAERCLDYLERMFALEEVPSARVEEMDLYRTVARVHVAEHAELRFTVGGGRVEPSAATSAPSITLTGDVEGVNFHRLPAGFVLGAANGGPEAPLTVLDVERGDVTLRFLELVDGRIRLVRPVTPAMYTTDPHAVRQDCLCYFMERIGAG